MCATQINIADTGCTSHFAFTGDNCIDVTPVQHGIIVGLPNNQRMQATHIEYLNLPSIPKSTRKYHIFPQMKNKVLLSIGQFCDTGYEARFTKHKFYVQKDNKLALEGDRMIENGLLQIYTDKPTEVTSDPVQQSNNVYDLQTREQIIKYLHQTAWSPIPETWIAAIEKGFYNTWRGLTSKVV